jgi:4'-phosphopantetheinyl transferase
LSGDEVHVWLASLDLEASRVKSLWRTLSADERERGLRFHFQRDREHFIVARGLLRVILGRYLNMKPSQIRFSYNRYGKPFLAGEGGGALRFNVSHSHRLALYAMTSGREIGIDLEHIRRVLDINEIAERFFSPREVAMLLALPEPLWSEAFFNCWTRKEAYIKAKGEGLSLPLDQFDVSLAPGEPAALLYTSDDSQEASRWSLQELAPSPGYVAALVVEGHDWQLKCWQWLDWDSGLDCAVQPCSDVRASGS